MEQVVRIVPTWCWWLAALLIGVCSGGWGAWVWQDNAYGKRVNASLRGVQFAGDGEAFGGGRPAEVDEFEDISDDRMAIVEESMGDILA